jgi:hypothetical protein
MSSSSRALIVGAVVLAAASARAASAGTAAQGFAVERFYPSAPEGGWLVMDALDMHGGIGGAMAMTLGYAGNPLRIGDGAQRLAVVSDEAFANFGFAVTYQRWRWYLDVPMPLAVYGRSGMVAGTTFAGPALNLGQNPDTLSDVRIGTDVRLVGGATSYFRFGLGGQLFVPSGAQPDYVTDGTWRGMVRGLFAGDVGRFTWAAQLGVHIRVFDEAATPGSPRGSELLFGAAGGVKLPVGARRAWAVVVGPELFGATAFHAFFGANGTALEALMSGRIEGTRDDRWQVRVRLGIGAGLPQRFGAPDWRIVGGVEIFNHHQH